MDISPSIFSVSLVTKRYTDWSEVKKIQAMLGRAVMLGEAALCLAKDTDKLPDRYGVLTPATAMGDVLDRATSQDRNDPRS